MVLSYVAGGNLMVGPERAVEGVAPQLAVFVLQSGGPPPETYLGQGGDAWVVTRVQVKVRSRVDAFQAGEALARALWLKAHAATVAGYVSCMAVEADPLYLGINDHGYHLHAFNIDMGRRRGPL